MKGIENNEWCILPGSCFDTCWSSALVCYNIQNKINFKLKNLEAKKLKI